MTIPVTLDFDNSRFKTKTIEIALSQSQIAFSSAKLQVYTSLHGLRYMMRHWFFTTAFLTISSLGFAFFLGALAFYSVAQ